MSNETLSTAVSTDKHIPVYLDTKEPIIWLDNNDATIESNWSVTRSTTARLGS